METRKFTDKDGKQWVITDLESFSESEKQDKMVRDVIKEIVTGEVRFIFPDKND